MLVKDKMTPRPFVVAPTEKVTAAGNLMKENSIGRLPVVDGTTLVGIVSRTDLLKVAPSPATTLDKYEINSLLEKMQVREIMSKRIISINQNAAIEEAALLMYNNKIGGMPVVDDRGAVCGIITDNDILKALIDMMGLPNGKKTRITMIVPDAVGVIKKISSVFTDRHENIDSFISYPLATGESELIIRGEFANVGEIKQALEEMGYSIQQVTQII